MIQLVKNALIDSIALKTKMLESERELAKLEEIGTIIYNAIKNGSKLLLCGNGGSAADSQHIAAEFVGRFMCERQPLAAIALTTDTSILSAVANDYGYNHIFERQIKALGAKGDVLIALSTSGNSKNIELAIEAANRLGIETIGLLGKSGGECKKICNHSIVIESNYSARVQELHITIGHILCEMVETKVSSQND